MKFVVLVTCLIHICSANIHSWGTKPLSTYRIYETTLIDDTNDVPKNYTIIHRFLGSFLKKVIYFEINVNAESTGRVRQSNDLIEPEKEYYFGIQAIQIFNAKIHIKGAKNVTAKISILGKGFPIYYGDLLRKQEATKGFTYIHKGNASSTSNSKQFAQNSIGKRRQGDQLIYFERKNIANISRFPSKSFEDRRVGIGSNQYITYVGFSFTSPTAMVMVNTSYIGEQEINAIVYDMNSERFVANMSVYVVKSTHRPRDFLGII